MSIFLNPYLTTGEPGAFGNANYRNAKNGTESCETLCPFGSGGVGLDTPAATKDAG